MPAFSLILSQAGIYVVAGSDCAGKLSAANRARFSTAPFLLYNAVDRVNQP
jgi:hypothetical protein